MADVHYFGQIVGGTGFDRKGLCCKWEIEASDSWEILGGYHKGQSHTDWGRDADKTVWAHPLDIHFECLALDGWPKLCLQVWSVDEAGCFDIAGYGFVNLPSAPGMYELECPTWVPEGTALERLRAKFAGGRPRLLDDSVVHSGNDRFRLCTTCSGTVHVRIGCITRDLAQAGVNVG